MKLRLMWMASLVLVAPTVAQELKFADLGDFRLESGETIRDCRIGYRTFGKLNAEKSNAVLFPTWFTGTTKDLVDMIGPGKLVDSEKLFVIAVDALGDGVTSSPSNSKLQPRMKFPIFTIRDMVQSQHAFLTRVLRIPHLLAVVGISMGGMQAFQWMVSFPEFMDLVVPIVGTPKLSAYDLLLWQAELHAIKADRAWKGGKYKSPPEAGMKTVADIHALAVTTPGYRTRRTDPEDFQKFLDATERSTMQHFDANNWVRQLEAMLSHDISKTFAGDMGMAAAAVKARVLIVVALQDHMVNPQPALAFASLLRARTLELDTDCGHLVFDCEGDKVHSAVRRFLGE